MCKIECVFGEHGKYGSDFKYGGKSIKISEHIRGLKSDRTDSDYIDYISIWKKEVNDKVANLGDFGLLSNYIQFFCRFCEITDEFITKHNVEEYHISLIRRMYFDYDDYEDDENGIYVTMGYKRPYGNSHVIGDIAEEYTRFVDIEDDEIYEWAEDNESQLLSIHMRTMEILDLALEELNMPLHFENNDRERFSDNWEISKTWQRNHKINTILGK